ncbi:LysR family transcriptional regulator [Alcaligenaceae bacterium 429]|uniref:LysR family transcriptional regulator n=1 Tax=Paenalcaligenes sp. Me52 TaxID=3392038 RepID=UPI001091D641|nr:LysR family transcriptional regulator [Alcaligenaceae bacterium 429]
MNLSIDQLQALVWAVQAGSFSQAAKQAGRSQSVISTHIANLEADLGVQVFDRSTRIPTLTPEGERIFQEAEFILQRREHLIQMAHSFEKQHESHIVMAIDEIFPECLVGKLLHEFSLHFPHTEVEIYFPLMDDVEDLVEQGKVDIGVSWRQAPSRDSLRFTPIGSVPLVLICGPDHPLRDVSPITVDELRKHRQILISGRNHSLSKKTLKLSLESWYVESHWVSMHMVMQHIGWAFVSKYAYDNFLHKDQLALLEIRDTQLRDIDQSVHIDVITSKSKHIGPALHWLIQRFQTSVLP